MFRKFDETIRLMASHKILLGSIIFSVCLPLSLVDNLFFPLEDIHNKSFLPNLQISMLLTGAIAPLYVGAFLFAFFRFYQKETVQFHQAFRTGLNTWWRLFAARFFAGIHILLGLCCFVLPGIYLLLRYAFIDAVVVLEGAGPGQALKRSAELTRGIRGRIFAVAVIFLIGIFFIVISFFSLLNFFEMGETLVGNILLDGLLDICFAILTGVLVLLYQETQTKLSAPPIELSSPNL